MPEEIDDLKRENTLLAHKLSLYEKDAVFRGYYALNKIVNQQVDILNDFNIKMEIGQNPKEDKQYDRVKAIWENLKTMIIDLNALKLELRITGSQEKDNKNVPFIERVAETRK